MERHSETNVSGARRRVLATVLGAVGLILLLFISQEVVQLDYQVAQLRNELATKEDLANLAVHLGPTDPGMAALETSCTDCHTRETFQEVHGITEDVHDLVTRMSQLSGAHVAPEEIPRVEAALTFMKCAHCHSLDRLKELAILSPRERWDVIVSMMREPGATISQADAQRIRDFYGEFWGWHTR